MLFDNLDNCLKPETKVAWHYPGMLRKTKGLAGKGGVIMALRNAYRRIQKWDKKLSGDVLSRRVAELKPMGIFGFGADDSGSDARGNFHAHRPDIVKNINHQEP